MSEMSVSKKLARRLWRTLPETQLKERVRTALHNRMVGAGAEFSLSDGVFITEIADAQVRTFDHPFEIVKGLREYQARHFISEGEIVLDAGAYSGHLTLFFASKVGKGGRVICVEPDDISLGSLRTNLELNPMIGNITLIAKALWDRECEIEFCQQGNVASSAFWVAPGSMRVRKRAISIDKLVNELRLPRLDFIKMDIEGAEINALHGARETLERLKPDLAIASYHIVDGKRTYPSVEAILSSLNYHVETVSFGKECITFGNSKLRQTS